MKPVIAITAAILIATFSWIWIGWLTLIVLPVTGLFVLMAFSPVLIGWEQQQAQPELSAPKRPEPSTLAPARASHPC